MELGIQHNFSPLDAINTLTDGTNQELSTKNIPTGKFGTQIPQQVAGRLVPLGMIEAVEMASGLPWREISGPSRYNRPLAARAAIVVILRSLHPKPWAFAAIGSLLNRDHTTVMNAQKHVASSMLGSDAKIAQLVLSNVIGIGAAIQWPDEPHLEKPEDKHQARPPSLWRQAYQMSLRGMSHAQIAEAVGCSLSNAGARVRYGRRKAKVKA